MLHIETVERDSLALLKKLMGLKGLQNFILVGGTALSLKYGHRKSIDLDLFSQTPFENQELKNLLSNTFDNFVSTSSNAAPGVFAYFDEIKVDFVKYQHFNNIRPLEIIDGSDL